MKQIKKVYLLLLFALTVLIVQPCTVKADDDVWYPVASDDEAVFYLADETMSTVYKYTISGFRGSSPAVENGSWVVDPEKLSFTTELITPSSQRTFLPPRITALSLYTSSKSATTSSTGGLP